MKKVISLVVALAMMMSMLVVAHADPNSVQAITVLEATDANGNSAKVVVQELPAEYKPVVEALTSNPEQVKVLVPNLREKNFTLVSCEAHIEGDGEVAFPVTLNFHVPQAATSRVLAMLHFSQALGAWENVSFSQSGSTVTATFHSLSPVVFAFEAADGNGNGVSPQTNDLPMEAALVGIMTISAVGAVYVSRRRDA